MEGDQTRIFREKLSQWIASQGFWFQLRHSMQGGGGWSMTVYHLGRVAIRCLLVLVLAAAVFALYLFKRTSSRSFQEGLDSKVGAALAAKQLKIRDFGRDGGEFKIRQLAAEGTPETFYNRLDASLIQFKAGMLGGIVGGWDVGTIRVDQLNVNLKAGADSAADAEAIGRSLVGNYPDFTFSGLDVKDATFVWGFSTAERAGRGFSTQGRIDNSHLKAIRSDAGWHLEFTGGTFSQNWLQKAAIETMIVDCDASGLRVREAIFKVESATKVGSATIAVSDLEIGAGETPVVSGRVKITQLDLGKILPVAVGIFMEGSISGDFKISGSTNTAEGIVATGEVKLDGQDTICLREPLPLLKAMSVIDNYHTYKRVEFNEGSFHLKTTAAKIDISAVNLKAGELMTLKGGVSVRQPTAAELKESPGSADIGVGMGNLGEDGGVSETTGKKKADINLRDAAKVANGKQGFSESSADLFDRHAEERMSSQAIQDTVARMSRALRYEGSLSLSLPPDAFERADVLRAKYPADPETKRIPMEIPINGTVGQISVGLSEIILTDGVRK